MKNISHFLYQNKPNNCTSSITMYDKESGEMKSGKFCSKQQMIKEMNLNISLDHVYRIYSGRKVDTNKTKKTARLSWCCHRFWKSLLLFALTLRFLSQRCGVIEERLA